MTQFYNLTSLVC